MIRSTRSSFTPVAALLALPAALLALAPLPLRAEIKERIAAVVNGQPISLSDVQERVTVEMQRVAAEPEGPVKDRERTELLKRGLEQLIDERLIEVEANAQGIDVGEDEVQKQVEALARQNGLAVPQFREAVIGQGLSWDTLRDSLRKQALQFRLLQTKVKPRKVRDDELQAAYAAMSSSPDVEVRARHIFISTPPTAKAADLARAEARASEVMRRLHAGEEFAVVARDLSDGPTAREGGDLGYFRKGSLFPEADSATFALEKGQVSPLLHTSTGYHLLKVEDRRTLPPRPLAEVADDLRNRITNESVMKERENYLRSLRKAAQIEEKL